MAVDAYTGLMRSGKSYSVVKNVILPTLREGRRVYTNIPMTDLAVSQFPGLIVQLGDDWHSDPDLVDQFEPGCAVVLDELWRRWPSGMKVNRINEKDKEFVAMHGHKVSPTGHTTRVVFLTQDLADIASFFRGKVAMTYRTTKLDAVGAEKRFRVDIYRGPVTGQKPPKTDFIRSEFDQYQEEIYQYYFSATQSETGNVGDESRADKRGSIWRSKFIIFSLFGPVLLIPLLLWYITGLFTSGFGLVEEAQAVENPPVHEFVNPSPDQFYETYPVVDHQPVSTGPVTPSISNSWRVVGSMKRGDKSENESFGVEVVILKSYLAGLRYVPIDECEMLNDGFSYKCEVDGEMATPWSGMGEHTQWAAKPVETVRRTATVASGATDVRSSGNALTNPEPPAL